MIRSPAIPDQRLAQALGWVVAIAVPLLDTLAETDLLQLKRRDLDHRGEQDNRGEQGSRGASRMDGALDKAAALVQARNLPGTAGWDAKPVSERSRWWANRIGAVGSLIASTPGVFGALADRLPIEDAFGFATQAVALCAVGREYGVTDREELVRMLAEVLCGRRLDNTAFAAPQGLFTVSGGGRPLSPWTKLASGLWQIARIALSITGELQKRPRGWDGFRLIGKLPVVGVVGDYLFEVGGVRQAVADGERWLAPGGAKRTSNGRGKLPRSR